MQHDFNAEGARTEHEHTTIRVRKAETHRNLHKCSAGCMRQRHRREYIHTHSQYCSGVDQAVNGFYFLNLLFINASKSLVFLAA